MRTFAKLEASIVTWADFYSRVIDVSLIFKP